MNTEFVEAPADLKSRNTQLAASLGLLALLFALSDRAKNLAGESLTLFGDTWNYFTMYALTVIVIGCATWALAASTVFGFEKARKLSWAGELCLMIAMLMPILTAFLGLWAILETALFPNFFQDPNMQSWVGGALGMGVVIGAVLMLELVGDRAMGRRYAFLNDQVSSKLDEARKHFDLGLQTRGEQCLLHALLAADALSGEHGGVVYPQYDGSRLSERIAQIESNEKWQFESMDTWLKASMQGPSKQVVQSQTRPNIAAVAAVIELLSYEQITPEYGIIKRR